MKTLVTSAAVAAVLVACLSSPLLAQQASTSPLPYGQKASAYKYAVVDISYVFKKHTRFQQSIESMKTEATQIQTELDTLRKQIQEKIQERDKLYKLNTENYRMADEAITKMKADLAVKAEQKQKSFLSKEADVYYRTYLEVQDAVRTYATRYGIGLVLRFNGEEVKPEQREDIIRGINKPVVFQDNIDITGDIIAMLNRDAGRQATRPVPGGQVPR